jgi:hypothetical protein
MIDPRIHRRGDWLLTLLFVWTLVGADAHRAAAAGASAYGERWVYCITNLQVDRLVDDVIMLIERAGRDGYNAVMPADYKSQILDRVPDFYFRNVERVKAAAAISSSSPVITTPTTCRTSNPGTPPRGMSQGSSISCTPPGRTSRGCWNGTPRR